MEDGGSIAPYTFSVISPATTYLGKNEERFAVTIPTTQTPTANSVDEAAQILYAVTESFEELPESVSLNFKHFTAYGKLSFVNLNLGGAKVTSVAITSSVDFANRWNYFVADDRFEENSGASTITLNTSATENLWFACAPVGEMNGKTLTFTINTDKGPLSKTVTLGENHKFEAGRIANMKVDMDGIEFEKSKVYELVTDAADLTIGSEIIIVASDSNQALSTTQNNNNRGQASVTKSSDKTTITDPGSAVQVITIEEGLVDESVAFNVGKGYLYAASSSNNYLRTEETLSENSSWIITILNGKATIKAQGTYTRNVIKYNSNNSIFSCYASGQLDVSIYKRQGTGSAPLPKLTAPVVTAELNDDQTGINVSWETVANATSYVISGIGDDVETSETSYSFEDLSSGTYNVTVTAKADGYRSATGSASVTVPSAGGQTEVEETISGTFTYANSKLTLTTNSGITIVQQIASGSTAVNKSYNTATTLRVYKGHSLTFSGKTITKIEIFHSSSYKGNSVTASTGTYTQGDSSSVWTGDSDNVVITNTGAGSNVQLRPTKIVVTYKN